MNFPREMLLIWAFIGLCLISAHALAADARFCGVVYRNATTHEIIRSAAVVRAFKREWPCITPCDATWRVDHTLPLVNGGCDSVINMGWMPQQIKSCAGLFCKDRWEQKVYNSTVPLITIYK